MLWFGLPEIHLKHFDADSDFRHILFGAIWSYLVIGAFLGLLSWTSSKVHNQKYWAENFKIITPSQMLPFPTLRKIENTILPPPSWDRFSPSLTPHFKNKWVGETDYSSPPSHFQRGGTLETPFYHLPLPLTLYLRQRFCKCWDPYKKVSLHF